MKKNLWSRFGVVVFFSGLIFILGAGSIVNAESGSIGGKPANPDPNNARTSTIFIQTIESGSLGSDQVEIINNSNSEKVVQVYAVDSVKSSGGAFACAQGADEIKDAGSWIKLDSNELKMAAGQKTLVRFNVSVPANAGVGEHNACIVMQEKKDSTTRSGVGLNFRTAIRVAILVPGDIVKSLSATGIDVKSGKDKVNIVARVKSNSNVSLDVLVSTKFKPLALGSSAEKETTFPVFRSEEAEWNFEFDKPFWGGFYTASYTASYDADTNLGLGEVGSGSRVEVAGPSKTVFVWPQPLALAVELVVALFVILLLVLVPKRILANRRFRKRWVDYAIKEGETIEAIAKKVNIRWKKLARLNRLKAPYTLVVGSLIKIPNRSLNDTSGAKDTILEPTTNPEVEPDKKELNQELNNDELEIVKELKKDPPKNTPKAKKKIRVSGKR